MTQAKICGLSTPEAVEAALAGGAAYVGFVFFPGSPRAVEGRRLLRVVDAPAGDRCAGTSAKE